MAELIPIEKALNNWATISIDKFQEALVKYNVGEVDGALMQSFTKEVTKADGDAFQVLIKFLKYGRFVDMNVGRGHSFGNPGHRIAKPWFSKQKSKEVRILRFIMAKNYSMMAISELEKQLKLIDKTSK